MLVISSSPVELAVIDDGTVGAGGAAVARTLDPGPAPFPAPSSACSECARVGHYGRWSEGAR